MPKYEILLCGNGSHLFRTMAWVLEYKGYKVETALSPEAALTALVAKNYDLVIAKLDMGEADGIDLLKRAKRLNPEVKLMVVSGNHEVTLPPEAYQIEVDDYLLMPVSPTELWRRVSRCLESLEVVDLVPTRTEPAQTPGAVNERVLDRLMLRFHDIRGSMVAHRAALKLLVRGRYGALSEKALGKLREISRNVDKMINLTEDFLAQTCSSLGEEHLDKEILDLRQDVVSPVLTELAGEIHRHGITLENRLEQNPPGAIVVKGSKVWLKSVFRNLVNNGIKHGGDGCTIVIDWQRQGENSRLNVFNSGNHLPEARRHLLFANLRGMRRAKGSDPGLGLDLHLSRDIVGHYGGDLLYEPLQNGSNLVVTLPQA